jgi:hypothetical protein
MAEYELIQDVNVGVKPKESKSEAGTVDHSTVSKAVEHGRSDAIGASAAMHLQRLAGNAAMGSLVQRKEEESPVHDVIGRGGGAALDEGVRSKMEANFGQDFGDVKVHTGTDAANASRSVQAQAFTVGNEIVFNEGKYNPSSDDGQRTIAHELTHVVQQRSGPVDGTPRDGGVSVSDPQDRFEQEAEATADTVMSGGHEGHDHSGGGEAAGVQREAEAGEQETEEDPTLGRMVQRQGAGPEEEAAGEESEE